MKKLALILIAMAVASTSGSISTVANAQNGPKTYINKCGQYLQICRNARQSHAALNYGVSVIFPCDGSCPSAKRSGYYYYYWR